MSPHVCPGQCGGPRGVWSPWRRPRPLPLPPPLADEYTYDLYAVCNHHGQDLQSGHYTAYCRNPYDGQWYCFDDAKVSPVNESQLVSAAAYILFYQRRGLVSPSSNSSCSSTIGLEHWAARLVHIAEEKNTDSIKRHSHAYSTLPPSSKHSVATETEIPLENIVNSPTCERREAQEETITEQNECEVEDDIKDIDADDNELSESRV
uniref:ubiquitinyl hydrolase 1 n=1 Tax=Cuerna arida TaxID=1464854 RepID=A0A1B6GRZ4_9HEMI